MKNFNFKLYKEKALQTCQPQCFNEEYLSLGLISEIGEIAGKLKRVIRDGIEIDPDDMIKELGDCLWYSTVLSHLRNPNTAFLDELYDNWGQSEKTFSVSDKILMLNTFAEAFIVSVEQPEYEFEDVIECIHNIAKSIGSNIQEVADVNNKKLADRKSRNKVKGEGDNR